MTIDDRSDGPFRKIENTDLDPVAVVAQCLDNQWVPRDLLSAMVKNGWSLNHQNVAERRMEDSRHEYLRSMLNSQQVIVNRAFFFNNPVV
jgi:lambda repressor-like predicted transcriptional regulator